MILQDIDHLKGDTSAFLTEANKRFIMGFFDILKRDFLLPSDNDFHRSMLHSDTPLLCMPPIKKYEILNKLHEKSSEVFIPLFLSEQNPQLVVNTLQGVLDMYDWDNFFNDVFKTLKTTLSNLDPNIDQLHRKDNDSASRRKTSYENRQSASDTIIKNLAKEICAYEDLNSEFVKNACINFIADAITKGMIEQQQMAQTMLLGFNVQFNHCLQSNNSVDISNMVERVGVLRDRDLTSHQQNNTLRKI